MNQRVEAVDAIRGFALFGILLVNITLIQFGLFANENPLIFSENSMKVLIGLFNFSAHKISFPILFLFGLSIILLQKVLSQKEKVFPHIYKTY